MKFINSRKVAFGSLGLVVSLFGVNVEGAIAQQEQSLQNLPDGNYAYREVPTSSSRLDTSRYFLFRKVGISVTGYHFRPYTEWNYCFQGQTEDSYLVNVTEAFLRFDRSRSRSGVTYDFEKDKSVNLQKFRQVNFRDVSSTYPVSKSFQECLNLFSSSSRAIPNVPTPSKPVKQIATIARYPTNDDFEKVDRILQASRNPDSLVNLKGNQQDQRRKFQKEWESRNPAAAKFLGSWYTGGKSFYVYPSTSKGGTCVITKDNQGNLDLQIGAVLNKELRYGGGKGFFWIDRENIIASRDSNSGDLYPIYATSEVPELSESIISDMQSQKCITTLPYATVAAALPSPLYENVTDPAFKLGNLYRINGMSKFFRIGLNAFEITDNGQTVKLNSAQVNPNVPTIIITHGWNNNLSSPEFRNLLKAVKENSSMQVLVVDWSQASQTGLPNLDIAATRIEASASKVADLIKKYKLKPSNISLIGHSLGAHLSVDLALELQKRDLGNVKSITLLDSAIDLPTGYQVKELSKIDKTTFIRAFYTSANGSSSLATSANESYNIKFPVGPRTPIYSHGEAITLLANSFQGDKDRNRNCISQQFMKLDEKFPNIDQNAERKRASIGYSKPIVDLYVAYDLNGWLYPKQIVQGSLDINSEKGNCNLDSDFNRMFDSIQYILK